MTVVPRSVTNLPAPGKDDGEDSGGKGTQGESATTRGKGVTMMYVLLLVAVTVTCSGVIFSDQAAIPDRKTLSVVKYKDDAGAVVGLLLWMHLPHSNLDTIALMQSFSVSYDSHLRSVTLHFKHQGNSKATAMPFDKCIANMKSLLGTDAAGKSPQENRTLLVNLQSLCEGGLPKFEAHPFGKAKSSEMLTNDQPFSGTAGDIPPLEVENFGGQGQNSFQFYIAMSRDVSLCARSCVKRAPKRCCSCTANGLCHENAL
jgi:hypothetical protein